MFECLIGITWTFTNEKKLSKWSSQVKLTVTLQKTFCSLFLMLSRIFSTLIFFKVIWFWEIKLLKVVHWGRFSVWTTEKALRKYFKTPKISLRTWILIYYIIFHIWVSYLKVMFDRFLFVEKGLILGVACTRRRMLT